MRFIRFETYDRDERSHARIGVVRAATRLRDGGRLTPDQEALLEEHLAWFSVNLPVPTQLALRRGYRRTKNAVCWFKDGAKDCLRRSVELVALLEEHGVGVRRLEVSRPGTVVYEDAHQVAAVPFGAGRSSATFGRRKKP